MGPEQLLPFTQILVLLLVLIVLLVLLVLNKFTWNSATVSKLFLFDSNII